MLTTEQLATLKADIQADPVLLAMWTAGNPGEVSNQYAMPAVPAFYVWRTNIPPAEYREAVTWTEVDALTAGKARIWEWLTAGMTQRLDSSKVNVRQGLMDCWAANSTTRANLIAIAKRTANRVEKLLATGTGTLASPATMGFEGVIDYEDVIAAMES